MTDQEAMNLKRGSKVQYKGIIYRIEYVREVRHNGSPSVQVKLRRGNDIIYEVPPADLERI